MEENFNAPIGGVVLAKDDLEYNMGRKVTIIKVKNCGNRPIQVGSHYHFFEVNRYLEFDRAASYGCHLNIPATTAIRFEPGQERDVELVPFGGKQYIMGFNGLVEGYSGTEDAPFYLPQKVKAIEKMKRYGFKYNNDEQNIKTTE